MPLKTNNIIKYRPETAGRRMITDIPIIHSGQTIGDVLNLFFQKKFEFETINYIYVTDNLGKLIGVFSIKELFRQPKTTRVKNIMITKLIVVRPGTDQERVSMLALKNNIKAVPVVGKENKFLGVVPSDTILEIFYTENREDIMRFAGANKSNEDTASILKKPILTLAKSRFPWLLIGLLGEGTIAAYLIKSFESNLGNYLGLTMFIPVMLYMGSGVGTQTQIIFVRNFALDGSNIPIKKYFFKELKISLFMAIMSGLILSSISFLWDKSIRIGIIVGTSLFCAMFFGTLTGMSTPWLLTKLKLDPAIGSGPLGTVIRDISSILIYFGIAWLLLKILI